MRTEALPETVRAFIAAAHVCRMATVDLAGEPHVVPLCPAFDGERTLYVDVGQRSANARNLAAHPVAEVVIDEYDDNWALLRGVILHCDVRAIKGAEREAAWELIRKQYPQHKEFDWEPRLTLVLRVRSWTTWGLGGPSEGI